MDEFIDDSTMEDYYGPPIAKLSPEEQKILRAQERDQLDFLVEEIDARISSSVENALREFF